MPIRRRDPIFGLPTPILFAHRGGAKEAPESTAEGFRHALEHGTDVLELDVQLTRDEEIVVWHGPSLDNVRLAIEEGVHTPRTRFNIGDYGWDELKNKAWVMHPENNETLETVPKDSRRLLLTLEEFMQMFADARLNIEMKESFSTDHLDRFISILNLNSPDRVGVVASNRNEHLLEAFRVKTGQRFATNLPLLSVLEAEVAAVVGSLRNHSLQKRALELPHPLVISSPGLIEQVREAGGGTYVFLTSIPFVKALDADKAHLSPEALFEILDRGVDGIMTDRPRQVRPLLDQWISEHPL